jgi:hypothetical protein
VEDRGEGPGPDPLDFHGTRLRSALGARFYAPVALMRAIHVGASTVSEPLLRPNPPEVSRHPALEGSFSVLHSADGASAETLCRASQLEIDALVPYGRLPLEVPPPECGGTRPARLEPRGA